MFNPFFTNLAIVRSLAPVIRKPIHRHPEEERRASVIRVRKIVGQLNAVQRMIEEDRDCAEILLQIVSARRGLKSLAEKLIHSHTHHCIEEADTPAQGRRKLRELLTVLERYVE